MIKYINHKALWVSGVFILAAFLRIWLSTTDAFLHEWDERFHALVAKNLLLHPLLPTLYETPLLNYDYREWAYNHVWLSKPPLPLWFIALSLKFWGETEWAVRFPSILFSLGSVFLTFKIAEHLYGRKIATWAAFFHAIHGFTLEVSSGRYSSDHVETIFLFWMELGFWAILKYYWNASNATIRRYALLLGLVTGLAFMCKWTAAFLLPIIWISVGMLSVKKLNFRHLFGFSVVFLLVTSPWVIYIFDQYPQEAAHIFKGVFIPVNETVQGHSGEWYFYMNEVRIMFGELIYLPMLWLFWKTLKTLRKSAKNNFNRLFISCWILLPLVLLSLAATKRSNYILTTAPAFFILTALFMQYILLNYRKVTVSKIQVRIVWFTLILLPVRYSVERSKILENCETNPLWSQQLKKLNQKKEKFISKTVIFNEPHPIEAMFYTGFTAYNLMPSTEKINEIKMSGWKVLEYKNGMYLEH